MLLGIAVHDVIVVGGIVVDGGVGVKYGESASGVAAEGCRHKSCGLEYCPRQQ